jgi:predicted enzyme related to lactoylglutathione lyase
MTTDPAFHSARPNLEVSDLTASIAFYEAALGLPLRFRADEFNLAVFGDEGGCELALLQVDAPHAASCYLLVTGVDVLHARCLQAGAPVLGAPETHPWGTRDFVVTDPDGNQIAVGQRVAPA